MEMTITTVRSQSLMTASNCPAVLFRKLKPFFYGLILVQFVTGGLWYVFYFVYVTWFNGHGALLYN